MKTRFAIALVTAALLTPATAPAAREKDDRPPLAIVVVENLTHSGGAISEYDRLDMAFIKLSKERKWPVAPETERFAANTPDYETELRIFIQPLREETPGELVFRGWVTLKVQGKEHDFGIVKFSYRPRLGEWPERTLESVYLGAAKAIANKVEPLLFPEEEKPAAGS